MKDNLVLLRVKNTLQERLIQNFCVLSLEKYDKRIIGIAVVKCDIGVLQENEKLLILENKDDLSVQHLIEQFMILSDYKDIEMIPLKFDIKRYETYNIIKAFRNNDIKYIPFLEVIDKYKKYLKASHKVRISKKVLSKEEVEDIYNALELPKNGITDKADYLDFYFNFGNKLELYKSLVEFKNNSEITWNDLRKLKHKNINRDKSVIEIARNYKRDTYEL